jgi:hypothetical protein
MRKYLAVLLFLSATALAQEGGTAYEALRTISGKLGRPALNHVISITGVDGDPQPQTWTVLLEDSRSPTGTREIQVTQGRVQSDRTPQRAVIGSARNATLKTSRLNLDSSGAFAVASRTADRSAMHFASANYTLRTDERGDPVWIVTLFSPSQKPVGTIHINSNRGNVVRTEGMFAGTTMEDVQTDTVAQNEPRPREHIRERNRDQNGDADDNDDGDDNNGPLRGVRQTVRGAFVRTQEEARGMFDRVRRSFTDFIDRH